MAASEARSIYGLEPKLHVHQGVVPIGWNFDGTEACHTGYSKKVLVIAPPGRLFVGERKRNQRRIQGRRRRSSNCRRVQTAAEHEGGLLRHNAILHRLVQERSKAICRGDRRYHLRCGRHRPVLYLLITARSINLPACDWKAFDSHKIGPNALNVEAMNGVCQHQRVVARRLSKHGSHGPRAATEKKGILVVGSKKWGKPEMVTRGVKTFRLAIMQYERERATQFPGQISAPLLPACDQKRIKITIRIYPAGASQFGKIIDPTFRRCINQANRISCVGCTDNARALNTATITVLCAVDQRSTIGENSSILSC